MHSKRFILSFFLILFFNVYSFAQTVTIGTQVWTTKNLNVTTFRNGEPIPQAKTNEEWRLSYENKQPAWCYYGNDPANATKYGILYNKFAVYDPRGLPPVGYHIPSDREWYELIVFLGGETNAGKKMKSTSGWNSIEVSKTCPNCKNWNDEYRRKVPCHTCKDSREVPSSKESGNGTNSSGFLGLPGGHRDLYGDFEEKGFKGYWWCSGGSTIKFFRMVYNFDEIQDNTYDHIGGSVRCIKD
jgi:uncharacterized protein (TIGR02145 family)